MNNKSPGDLPLTKRDFNTIAQNQSFRNASPWEVRLLGAKTRSENASLRRQLLPDVLLQLSLTNSRSSRLQRIQVFPTAVLDRSVAYPFARNAESIRAAGYLGLDADRRD